MFIYIYTNKYTIRDLIFNRLPACRPLRLPEGLEDVSKVPNLVAELLRRGWTDEEVKAALGNNLLRVLTEVEEVKETHILSFYGCENTRRRDACTSQPVSQ